MELYQGEAHKGLLRNGADNILFLNLDSEYRVIIIFKVFTYLYALFLVRKVSENWGKILYKYYWKHSYVSFFYLM